VTAQPLAPEKRAARRAFDRAARTYDDAAALQQEVGRRLLEHLDPITARPKSILEVGCGTGAQLAALAGRYPAAKVIGLDVSAAMLARARSRAPWWRRVARSAPALLRADAEKLPFASGAADLIFSNLVLHWCEPDAFFGEMARALSTGGLLLFSTFGPDTLRELRSAFAGADVAPHVHSFIDMHDLGDALVHAGFGDPVMEMENITVEYADVAAMARELRATGSANAWPGRRRGLMTPARW
jgi:malonyl-CoA O-methyltransferase